jgi:hypothetical protein
MISYFRLGYSYYISFPLTILNFMTVTYYLMMERIPFLKDLFPNFITFTILLSLCLMPCSTILGYLHARRTTAMAMDSYVATRANPLNIVPTAITLRQTLELYRRLNIPISPEFMRLVAFYEQEEKKQKWKP